MGPVLWIIVRRIVLSVAMLWMVSVLVFVGVEVLPGDALEVSIPPEELFGLPPGLLDERRRELGLDRPAIVRYGEWFAGIVQGDFGRTLINKEPVIDRIRHPLRNTLLMAAVGLLVVPLAALVLGILAALRPGGRLDTIVSGIALLGYSIPEFVLGNLLIYVFAVLLPWQDAVITLSTAAPVAELLAVLTLPTVALLLGAAAYQLRLVRAAMAEAMGSEFAERARLSGLSQARVVLRHALPVALVPTLAGTAQFLAALLSGLLVIEFVFNYPGLGVLVVEAIASRDVATIEAIAMMAAFGVLGANLLSDLLIVALDPRVRSRVHV